MLSRERLMKRIEDAKGALANLQRQYDAAPGEGWDQSVERGKIVGRMDQWRRYLRLYEKQAAVSLLDNSEDRP
jgi:hypothetical protein